MHLIFIKLHFVFTTPFEKKGMPKTEKNRTIKEYFWYTFFSKGNFCHAFFSKGNFGKSTQINI